MGCCVRYFHEKHSMDQRLWLHNCRGTTHLVFGGLWNGPPLSRVIAKARIRPRSASVADQRWRMKCAAVLLDLACALTGHVGSGHLAITRSAPRPPHTLVVGASLFPFFPPGPLLHLSRRTRAGCPAPCGRPAGREGQERPQAERVQGRSARVRIPPASPLAPIHPTRPVAGVSGERGGRCQRFSAGRAAGRRRHAPLPCASHP